MSLFEQFKINKSDNFVGSLPQNIETIKLIEEAIPSNVTDIVSLVNYFFYSSYIENQYDSIFLEAKEQRIFDQILEKLKDICDISIAERNKLINQYYKEIAQISSVCIYELIKHSHNKGVKDDVRYFIAENYYRELMVKDYYEKYMNVLIRDAKFSFIVLNSFLQENAYVLNSEEIIQLLMKMDSSRNQEIIEVVKNFDAKVTEVFNNSVSEDLTGTEQDQIFYLYNSFYDVWVDYLKGKKSEQVYLFEKTKKIVKEKFNKVINEYGLTIRDSIDIRQEMDEIKEYVKKTWNIVIYDYTHVVESNGYHSLFQSLSNVEEPLTDLLFDRSQLGNIFFRRGRIIALEKMIFFLTHIFNHFVNHEFDKLNESLRNYTDCFDMNYTIDEQYKIRADMNVLIRMISEVKKKSAQSDIEEVEYAPLYYGPTMFICAVIEKILRNYYLFCRKNIDYTESKHISLNSLLDEKKDEIVDLLGIEQIHVLRYYLILDDGGIGMNIRNRLAHLDGLANPRQFYTLFITTFTLLCSILSSVVLQQVEEVKNR